MRPFVVLVLIAMGVAGTAAFSEAAPRKSTNNPRFDASVDRGLAFLKKAMTATPPHAGEEILAAYALFKCGEPPESPLVAKAIQSAVGRSSRTTYQPVGSYDHIYGAGVDAMFLADVSPETYKPNLQIIANYIQSVQRADGSWSDSPTGPGDVSMSQYGVLGLWAAQRAGCIVAPEAFDRAANFHMKNGNPDGGWGYRPGTTAGPGQGSSTHNMTMAAAGSVSVIRLVLHGGKGAAAPAPVEQEKKFGLLEKVDPLADLAAQGSAAAYADYRAQNSASSLDQRVDKALGWNDARFTPVSKVEHNLYFYYCVERAASINNLQTLGGRDWFTAYGEGLLSLQSEDGGFPTFSGPIVGTSFALLFYMRSTQQIIEGLYGKGLQRSTKGNPFGDKTKEPEPTALDQLLSSMENIDLSDPKLNTDVDLASELVRSVQSIEDPEVLVGQVDRLKGLVKHPSAEVRQPVYWALGRTGDFSLIPLILNGLRDPNVDVNVEAEMALRYIARKPAGFGLSANPKEGVENAPEAQQLQAVNQWRDKAFKAWSTWYFERRPFEERNGFDELEAKVPSAPSAPSAAGGR